MANEGFWSQTSFSLPGSQIKLKRLGYGAMQLAGPHVFGPPRDMDAAFTVLREAIALGVNHIDTSDFYGPHITNQIIKQALHPYEKNLTIVTKVGARRGPDKSWILASSREELTTAIHDNLRNLALDALDVVNLRVGPPLEPADKSLTESITTLVELKKAGLIRHIGVSNVTPKQLTEALAVTEIVCVQNQYNLVSRTDDETIKECARRGIAYVPYFPTGGSHPLQSTAITKVATELGATPNQVALAWLLHRSPNILLIPGTSSVQHLRENMAVPSFHLSQAMLTELNASGGKKAPAA